MVLDAFRHFTFDTYEVKWCGWRHSPNQLCEYGFWVAWRPKAGNDASVIVSTTTGKCQSTHELHCIDMTLADGVPPLTPLNDTPELRASLEDRALTKLLEYLLDASQ